MCPIAAVRRRIAACKGDKTRTEHARRTAIGARNRATHTGRALRAVRSALRKSSRLSPRRNVHRRRNRPTRARRSGSCCPERRCRSQNGALDRQSHERPAGQRHHAGQAAAERAALVIDVRCQRRDIASETHPGGNPQCIARASGMSASIPTFQRLAQDVVGHVGSGGQHSIINGSQLAERRASVRNAAGGYKGRCNAFRPCARAWWDCRDVARAALVSGSSPCLYARHSSPGAMYVHCRIPALAGRHVIVTRPSATAPAQARMARRLGARVVRLPGNRTACTR